MDDFERRLCAQTPVIFYTIFMSQINPKKFLHNTIFSVQLPYIAGHSLYPPTPPPLWKQELTWRFFRALFSPFHPSGGTALGLLS